MPIFNACASKPQGDLKATPNASSTHFDLFSTNSQKILLDRGGTQIDVQKILVKRGGTQIDTFLKFLKKSKKSVF